MFKHALAWFLKLTLSYLKVSFYSEFYIKMNDNYWAIIKRCDLRENSEVIPLSKSKYSFGRSEGFKIFFQ